MNGAATQIFSREFDTDFFRLPLALRELIQKNLMAWARGLQLSRTFA